MIPAIIVAIFLSLGVVLFGWFLKHKHRLIWNQIWSIKDELNQIHRDNVDIRKMIVLSTIGELRLPPKMPSQDGEDLLLYNYFEGKKNGFFVDIGAHDGVTFSNSYFFEALGWDGLLVEANPSLFEICGKNRPFSKSVHGAICGSVDIAQISLFIPDGEDTVSFTASAVDYRDRIESSQVPLHSLEVPAFTIDTLLQGAQRRIDFISIDIEGAELEALKGFSIHQYDPEVVIVENNNPSDHQINDYLAKYGYVERHRTGTNFYFLKRDNTKSFHW